MSVLSGFGRSRTISLRPDDSNFPLGRLSFDTQETKYSNTEKKNWNNRTRNISFNEVLQKQLGASPLLVKDDSNYESAHSNRQRSGEILERVIKNCNIETAE